MKRSPHLVCPAAAHQSGPCTHAAHRARSPALAAICRTQKMHTNRCPIDGKSRDFAHDSSREINVYDSSHAHNTCPLYAANAILFQCRY